MNPHHGKSMGLLHGETARRNSVPAALLATIALLAAACSGSPSSTGASPDAGGSSTSASVVAYSHCIRSHGVPKYPDPSNGQLPKGDAQAFGVGSSVFSAAQRTCQHVLPSTGGSLDTRFEQCVATGNCPQALVQQVMNEMRKFALCMRSHGVPNWPDPIIGRGGAPFFNVSAHGITHSESHSPPIITKIGECERVAPSPVLLG